MGAVSWGSDAKKIHHHLLGGIVPGTSTPLHKDLFNFIPQALIDLPFNRPIVTSGTPACSLHQTPVTDRADRYVQLFELLSSSVAWLHSWVWDLLAILCVEAAGPLLATLLYFMILMWWMDSPPMSSGFIRRLFRIYNSHGMMDNTDDDLPWKTACPSLLMKLWLSTYFVCRIVQILTLPSLRKGSEKAFSAWHAGEQVPNQCIIGGF